MSNSAIKFIVRGTRTMAETKFVVTSNDLLFRKSKNLKQIMSEVATLRKELKNLSKQINTARNKKMSTGDAGKRIKYESEIEELEEKIKAVRDRIKEIEADPNYVPEPETPEKKGLMGKLKGIFG